MQDADDLDADAGRAVEDERVSHRTLVEAEGLVSGDPELWFSARIRHFCLSRRT
jgi:hypothetical protein